MKLTNMKVVLALCILPMAAGLATANAGHSAELNGTGDSSGELVVRSMNVDGCDILILWHTWRGDISASRSEVRVRGALGWTKLVKKNLIRLGSNKPRFLQYGKIFNWSTELRQNECDKDRRYRFRIVAPTMTGEPVRSNEPYAGTERWLYVPSSNGWTRQTRIDVGYLDLCVIDGTKCGKPYYPSGPTPVVDPKVATWVDGAP